MLIENPLISVILPVFNSEKTLERSIKSILNQTFKSFELIIINDCSTDNSSNIINNYLSSDKRIKVINNSLNIGLTQSLILGINSSKAEYLARIDADEYAKPSRLHRQYLFMKSKNLVLCGSQCLNLYKVEKKVTKWRHFEDQFIEKIIPYRSPFPHGSTMYKKTIYKLVGGYNSNFQTSQDFELWNRFKKKGKVSMINENLIYRYIIIDSITNKKRFKQFLDTTKIRIKYSKIYQLPWVIFYSLLSLIISYLPNKVFLIIKKYL